MAKIIGAPTLDDALTALGREVAYHEAKNEHVLVFCEDRLTLLAERAAIRLSGGSFLTEVTTFARYLSGEAHTVSKFGSVMALSAIMEEEADNLRCFGVGAAQAVYETLAQLLASRVTADMLRESASLAGGMLARKLADLALLLERYEAFLQERNLLDENGFLALLPQKIERERPQAVLFFGFSSFTKQAREGVRAALSAAGSVTGIFLAGRERFYTNEAAHIFRTLCEERGSCEVHMEKSTLSGDAAILQRELFNPDGGKRQESDSIFVFEAADDREEFSTVAAYIKREVSMGRRYRDISVLVGSADDLPAAEKAFSAQNIPYYLDRRRKYAGHPFCAFVLSVFDAAANGGITSSAADIASSVYFGDGGAYRNYLSASGGRYAARREIREGTAGFEELKAAREKLLSLLSLVRPKDTGAGYVNAVRRIWELVDGEKITERLSSSCEEERAFLDISKFSTLLDETEKVVPAGKFTARQFYHLLENGLDALEISMLPRRADAVFVGDIGESRLCRSEVLFLAGMTEAVPRISQDTAVITDAEIGTLSKLRVEVEPAIAVVNARAREAFALNVCAFSEALYVSCPRRKKSGEVSPSELFLYLRRAFSLREAPPRYPFEYGAFAPALAAYFSENGVRGEALREAFLKDIFGHGMPVDPEEMKKSLQKTPQDTAPRLWFSPTVSPTVLESYFECPYKSFAKYGLHLFEQRKTGNAADAGTFVHTVLEQTARLFNNFSSEEECETAARDIAKTLLAAPLYAPLSETKAGAYTGERLAEEAASVAKAAYRQLAGSNFRVAETESDISLEGLSLRGKADRVDETDGSVRVIDYKTGDIDASVAAYYTGRKLQLELYLLAAAEKQRGEGKKRAAGAFYFPAADDVVAGDKLDGKFRLLGFFCNEPETVRDMDTVRAEGEASAFFSDGERSEKGMDRAEFEDFLEYARLVSKQAEGEMRQGNIRPSPYGESCTYCQFKGLCGFCGTPRKERDIGCGTVTEIVRNAKAKEES